MTEYLTESDRGRYRRKERLTLAYSYRSPLGYGAVVSVKWPLRETALTYSTKP